MSYRGNVLLVLMVILLLPIGAFAHARHEEGGVAYAAREIAQYEREVVHLNGLLDRLRERIEEKINNRREQLCRKLQRMTERYPNVVLPSYCKDAPASTPELTFNAIPNQLVTGGTSTLSWLATNATSCVASEGWSGSKPLGGSLVVAPGATTTYTLTCTGDGGSIVRAVTVGVTEALPVVLPPTVDLTASPTSVIQGSSTELTWTTSGALSCEASGGWSGARATTGLAVVTPSATTTYTLACGNSAGTTSDSVVVSVAVVPPPLPVVDLTANPGHVVAGGTSTLSWTTSGAAYCSAGGGWNGAQSLTGSTDVVVTATTTYLLSCGNVAGTSSDSVTVYMVREEEPLPVPSVDLSAEPASVTVGGTSTLSWNTAHAVLCTASGAGDWTGAQATTSGAGIVAVTATTTYSLTCSNGTGTTTDSVTVAAVPAPLPSGPVLISEVLFDPASGTQGSDANNEWVEIHNGTNAPINLNGWTLHDTILGTATDTLATTSLPLPAGGFAVITRSTTTDTFWSYPAGTVVIHLNEPLGSAGLSNTGEAVALRDVNGVLVDAVSWGTDTSVLSPSVPVPSEGISIARTSLFIDTDTSADWASSTPPTPGA